MKKARLFAKIIYYVFTFSIGIILALFLPFYYMYDSDLLFGSMEKSLAEGNYAEAMGLVGGFYNTKPVLQQQFESGGGIVLFEAATLVFEEEKDTVNEAGKLHTAYAGFVYGVKDVYNVSGENNKTMLVVTNADNVETQIALLNYDSDGDGENDTITTMSNGFFYVDIAQEEVGSVANIRLVDAEGKDFYTVSTQLSYDEAFFQDVADFITVYNNKGTAEECEALAQQLLKNEDYAQSSYGVAPKGEADKRAAVFVVVYFVVIYVIADFLIGRRYILRFFKWLLVKVFKVKFKEKAPPKEEVFGHDYYCQVTIMLDVSVIPDFSDSVTVRYSNTEGEAEFLFLKENGYTVTQRVKAGTYVNLYTDLAKSYSAQNLPEKLVVEGYKKALKINIIRRED